MGQIWSHYDADDHVNAVVAEGHHRSVVGGLWDELGRVQLQAMTAGGLQPSHRLLDLGCGSLRGGVQFVRFLESDNYYGLDRSQALLDAGYEQELIPLGLADKLSRDHLLARDDFDASEFGVLFDRVLALSLFTHLPLDRIRVALERVAEVVRPGGIFYASWFEVPEGAPTHVDLTHDPGGVVTHGGHDPFHHRFADLVHLAKDLPWDVVPIGDFGHPRNQQLVSFVRREPSGPTGSTRQLSVRDAAELPAGSDHYRAFVGPPERFDILSASQFALLFQLGLRDHHTVLDFGCGSLRLGRLLIPYLRPGGYAGIDPNSWLIDEGIDRELGRSALTVKRPRFSCNDDFDCTIFGTNFDFVVAQSIITHTGPDLLARLLRSATDALAPGGMLLFSYIRERGSAPQPQDGWHYPGCVGYGVDALDDMLDAAGLQGCELPWHHPGATWHLATKKGSLLSQDLGHAQVIGRPWCS